MTLELLIAKSESKEKKRRPMEEGEINESGESRVQMSSLFNYAASREHRRNTGVINHDVNHFNLICQICTVFHFCALRLVFMQSEL